MRRSNVTTLRDIAKDVGVSTMTVSAVINGTRSGTRVSETTRQRILDAARRLKYRPNAVAQGLSRRRMSTVGVVSHVQHPNDINLIMHELLNGILEGANVWNQNTIVCSVADWNQEQKILGLCDGRLDGLILIGPSLSDSFSDQLYAHTEYVSVHSDMPPQHGVNFDADNFGGAYAMTKYLISLGHRRIGHFAGNERYEGTPDRFNGYKTALEEAGIVLDPSLVVPGYFAALSGNERALRMVDSLEASQLPTALFCSSDAIASGAVQGFSERGMRVPEDISIAGFDDSLVARMSARPITTIRQPLHAMGRAAIEQLLEQIDLDQPDNSARIIGRTKGQTIDELLESGTAIRITPANEVLFRGELVVRESVGLPRQSDEAG